MKRLLSILLSSITILGISVPVLASDENTEKSTVKVSGGSLLISNDISKDAYNNIVINEKNINIGNLGVVINNGNVMVPLKATAEGLGFKVEMDKDNKTVYLKNDEIDTSIILGEDKYYFTYSKGDFIACAESMSVGSSPMVIDNLIYIPIKAYDAIFNKGIVIGSFWSKTKDSQLIYVDKGELTLGWKLIDNKWYFMNSKGIMQKGWVQTNNNWYYLYEDGHMASSTITPDGYKVDQSGKWNFENTVSILDTQTARTETIENPIEEFKTIEDAQKVMKFKVIVPKDVPQLFNVKYISTISRGIFQISYSNGEKNIIFRMGQGIDNISGVYEVYNITDTINLDGKNIKLSGNGEFIKLATWNINNMSYSVFADNGMKKDDIIKLIKSTV